MRTFKQHLKENESQFLTYQNEIEDWLKYRVGIEHFTINSDNTVDITYDVFIGGENLTKIPVKFGKVNGDFACFNNQLTSLAGCPSEVAGDFYCYNNDITSLEGIADQLTSIKGRFVCDNGKIKSHVLGLILIEGITEIVCRDKWAVILNHCIVKGKDIYEAQAVLLDAGLEDYAQL